MCCTLGEFPLIRYARTPVASALAAAVSDAFEDLSEAEKEQLNVRIYFGIAETFLY
jgi:hypothetical protein